MTPAAFSFDRAVLRDQISGKTWLLAGLMTAAIAAVMTPVINPRLPLPQKLAVLSAAMGTSLLSLGQIEALKRLKSIDSGLDNSQMQHLQQRLTTESGLETLQETFERQIQVVNLIRQFPEEYQGMLAQMAGVAIAQPQPQPPQDNFSGQTIEAGQVKPIAELQAADQEIDVSWFNHGWLYFPAAVVGGQGTGKSFMLKARAVQLLMAYPNSTIIVIDFHDDPTDTESEPWSQFIEGIEVIQNADDAWKALCHLKKTLDERIQNHQRCNVKDSETPIYRIIWDEFQDGVEELGKARGEEAYKLINSINGRQGRKYGCGIDLGYHDFTKEASGISLETLKSMGWALMEDTIANPNLKMPRTFNVETLTHWYQMLHATLPPNFARCLVFKRAAGDKTHEIGAGEPVVVAFPKPVLPKIRLKNAALVPDEPEPADSAPETEPANEIEDPWGQPSQPQAGTLDDLIAEMQAWIQGLNGRSPSDHK